MAESESGDVTAVDVPSRCILMISFERVCHRSEPCGCGQEVCRNLARRSLCALTPFVLANRLNGVGAA